MIDVVEDSRTEFKVKLVADLEETVIAFLNKDGGNIYIGVDDNGNIVGLKNNMDLFQRNINDKIISFFETSFLWLFVLEFIIKDDIKFLNI